jgi:hypothetical protein
MSALSLLCAAAIALSGCAIISHGVAPSAWYDSYTQSRS